MDIPETRHNKEDGIKHKNIDEMQGPTKQEINQQQNLSQHNRPSNHQSQSERFAWYDKWYKTLLVIPVIILIISLIYLFVFYSKHGDVMYRDTTLAGGTTITLNGEIQIEKIETALKTKFDDISIRKITDISTNKQLAVIIETSAVPEEVKTAIEKELGRPIAENEASVEFTGSTLSNNFYKQLLGALLVSFVLMSLVIFYLFRSFIPSIAVIFAAFSDIVMPLALVNIIGVKLSAAGIAAFLMLVGYSVDTDILLTTRVMKKSEGTVNERIYGAFKTGIFMTLTALAAVVPAFFLFSGLPNTFRQIFLILALGLSADIINTWMTNASIIKWYAVKRGMR